MSYWDGPISYYPEKSPNEGKVELRQKKRNKRKKQGKIQSRADPACPSVVRYANSNVRTDTGSDFGRVQFFFTMKLPNKKNLQKN